MRAQRNSRLSVPMDIQRRQIISSNHTAKRKKEKYCLYATTSVSKGLGQKLIV